MVHDASRAVATIRPVLRELSLFAQLVVALVDGSVDLPPDRAAALRAILTHRVDI
jgi:hypothetical protein